jgi:hypothetical protein
MEATKAIGMAMISTQRQPSFLSLLVLGEFVDADALLMSVLVEAEVEGGFSDPVVSGKASS